MQSEDEFSDILKGFGYSDNPEDISAIVKNVPFIQVISDTNWDKPMNNRSQLKVCL